ncbi:MAG: endo alpha-1,4 polygalactosaminidase [Rhodobacteraceae bacterium]|nr:endo alpha-1,4 polygalactosaminidase [Paracoccaceae bacterium]
MRRITSILLALVLGAVPAMAAPDVGAAWDWQLGESVRAPQGIEIFDTDPDSASARTIAQLNARGVYTICYVSVGTLENYRDDRRDFPRSVVGRVYGDWPDERFLDVRQLDVLLPLMQARFQRCKDMGFDAIEPDNMDVYDNESGFRISRRDGIRYIKALADMAHGMGLEIGQKNVPEITRQLIGSMDFVITEDCFSDGWCEDVSAYTRAGKPVLAAEYTDTGVSWAAACAYGRANGYSMILKDRDLSAALQTCP